MTARYAIPATHAHELLQGRLCAVLLPDRKAPARLAYVGEPLVLTSAGRVVAHVDCALRAAILLDPHWIRTALPVDHRSHPEVDGLAQAVKDRVPFALARMLGFWDWPQLVSALAVRHGPPPWALELVGWVRLKSYGDLRLVNAETHGRPASEAA